MKKIICLFVCLFVFGNANASPILNTSNFISAANRTNFNGFENIPNDGTFFTGGSGPYTEDSIKVEQINPDAGNDIWLTLGSMEGAFSWYPNGGDNGYTQISLADGTDFSAIELIFRSYSVGNVRYSLWDDGVSVLDGFLASSNSLLGTIGFEGGGFDQVLLRSGTSGSDFFSGEHQALQIDSIELAGAASVPEPTSLALLGLGLAGLGFSRKKKTA